MPLQTGQILNNRYRIVKLLGQGGFGAVYRAWDLNLKKPCALKENFSGTNTAQQQFFVEAQILSQLNHPNLPRVTDYFAIPAQGEYLVMDFIEGENLENMLKANGALPVSQVLAWTQEICEALDYLHNQNPPVIHRDIKPSNLIVPTPGKSTTQGEVVLVDFGIAKIFSVQRHTGTGARGATPGFSPPEQYMKAGTDARSDLYALGATLYALLTGTEPTDSLMRQAGSPLLPPRTYNPGITQQTETAILKAMAINPDERFQTAGEFKAALTGKAITAKPTSVPMVVWGALFVVICGMFAGGLLLGGRFPGSLFPTETPFPITTQVSRLIVYTPTPTPTITLSPTITPTPTNTPTPTPTPTPTLPPAFSWITEVIQRAQAVGYFTSLVIDRLGYSHIAYFQENSDVVWHSHNDSGEWIADYVIGGQGKGFHLSLQLDLEGNPHIAYHIGARKQTPRVQYLHWTGQQWELLTVTGSYSADTDISLSLGPDDRPHITFMDGYSYVVKYANYNNQRGWDVQTVDTSRKDCQSFPLFVDQDGIPHLLYCAANGGLMYATLIGNVWNRIPVDQKNGAGLFSDLVLDSNGNPHVAYYDSQTQSLHYAYLNGDTWDIQIVDDQGDVGKYPSIAVDPNGHIHVSYYDASNTALKYVHGREGNWNFYLVDNVGDVGEWNSLALSPEGLPRISYLDRTNEDLKIALASPLINSGP